jgi:hypothetical protein
VIQTVPMSVLVPAVAALAGAFIGSLGPMVVGIIQSRAERKRERMRLAAMLAIDDQRAAIEMVKLTRPGSIPPLSTFVAYHADVLALVAKGRSITPENMVELRERARAVMDAVKGAQAEDPKSPQRP